VPAYLASPKQDYWNRTRDSATFVKTPAICVASAFLTFTFDVILDQNVSGERGLYGVGVIITKEGIQYSLRLIYDAAIPWRAHHEEKCCPYICCVLRRDDATKGS
jgi:hypothetical protein